ncbi:MAG: hypothetical protein H6974_10030 [Gammaproteobacteria bacterium]|nr:hypothetical protein [Gammaproteobacteria bacterium]
MILRAYEERSGLRGLSRTFGVSRNTVGAWLKKARTLPPLEQILAPSVPDEVLELDELWTFVSHRRCGVLWLWLAFCAATHAPDRRLHLGVAR